MALMKNVSEFNKLRVQLFIEAVLNEGRLERPPSHTLVSSTHCA